MNCPICKRPLLENSSSVDKHHLIPKSCGGTETILIHRICHQKLHSLFTEKELAKRFYTIELITAHEEIKKFNKWLKNKPADFYDKNLTASRKRR